MNVIHTLLIILVILTIVVCVVVQPNSNETNTNSKPMIRIAPSGQPVTSPHGRTRIGIDIMTGKPILIL